MLTAVARGLLSSAERARKSNSNRLASLSRLRCLDFSSTSSSSDVDDNDRPTEQATATPASDRREVLLLRDYISRRLSSYFSAPAESSPVGELSSALRESSAEGQSGERPSSPPPPSSLDFPSFSGRSSYELALSKLYERLSVSWLTPSELFSPHYGRAVARFVAEDAKRRAREKEGDEEKNDARAPRLRVVEVGAGKGTLAADFLRYLREVEPGMHARTRYVTLEFSESLAEAQGRKVASSSALFEEQEESSSRRQQKHASFSLSSSPSPALPAEPRFLSVVGDAMDLGSWRRAAAAAFGGDDEKSDDGNDDDDDHLYILAFEVLDNLPHDRVVSESNKEGERIEDRWLQTHVEVEILPCSSFRAKRELLRSPADDRLISLCLSSSEKWKEGKSGESRGALAGLFDWMLSAVDGGGGGGGRGRKKATTSDGFSDVDDDESRDVVFLPTGAASMFSSAFAVAPNHTVVAADFDALPGVVVRGANAPLVSSTSGGGVATDYGSLYSPPPGAAVDIFFPTNFDALCDLYLECGRRREREREGGEEKPEETATDDGDDDEDAAAAVTANHCKSSAFLLLAADTPAYSRAAVSTLSGWSPMLDDWENTSVFVGRSRSCKGPKRATERETRDP